MPEHDRTVLLVVGPPDRYQRRLIEWARRASPGIGIAQPGSVNEASARLRALDHPEGAAVVVYVRWRPDGSNARPPGEALEEEMAACRRKLVIRETPFSHAAADYFRRPRGTAHTFLLPAAPPLSPGQRGPGAISAYPYLLIGKFLEDRGAIERLGARPQEWQNWVREVVPLEPRPKMHALSDLPYAVWGAVAARVSTFLNRGA